MNFTQRGAPIGGPPLGGGLFYAAALPADMVNRFALVLAPMVPTSDVILVSGTVNGGSYGILDPHNALGLQRQLGCYWIGSTSRTKAAQLWPAWDFTLAGTLLVYGDEFQGAMGAPMWQGVWLAVVTQ